MWTPEPTCKVCQRQGGMQKLGVHTDLCQKVVGWTGSIEAAKKALENIQDVCPHTSWSRDYEYVPGGGRDHWWWCNECGKLTFTNPKKALR